MEFSEVNAYFMIENSLALSRADKELYQEHKKFIREHAKNWVEVWARIVEVRDKKLYLAEYTTFANFCVDVLGLSDRMARYYIQGWKELQDTATGTQVPPSEKALRKARQARRTIEVEATVMPPPKPEPDRFAGMSRKQLVSEFFSIAHQLRLANHENRLDRMKKIVARLLAIVANLQRVLHHPTQVSVTSR